MAKNRDNDLIKRHQHGSVHKGTVGGYVLTDRDYSGGFKKNSTKNLVIVFSLLPILLGIIALWTMGLKFFALSVALAVILISLLAFFVTKASL